MEETTTNVKWKCADKRIYPDHTGVNFAMQTKNGNQLVEGTNSWTNLRKDTTYKIQGE